MFDEVEQHKADVSSDIHWNIEYNVAVEANKQATEEIDFFLLLHGNERKRDRVRGKNI